MEELNGIQEVIKLVIENQALLIPAIMAILANVVVIATAISKVTPNETDNKWVGYFAKIVQVLAIHATPTKVIKK